MTDNNGMKPVDAGAPVLIPQGNLTNVPGSYGSMQAEYWKKKNGKKFSSKTTSKSAFRCGYFGPNSEVFSDIDMTCTMP